MIKKVAKISFVFFLLLGIVLGLKMIKKSENKKEDGYVAIGDYLLSENDNYSDYLGNELIKNKKVSYYDNSIKRSSLDSNDLARFLEIDASVIKNNKAERISNILKNAKYVTIQVGLADLKNNLRFNKIEEKYYYSSGVVETTLARVQENVYDIVNKIKEINPKATIYVLGYYFPYPSIKEENQVTGLELYGMLNQALETASYDSDAKFISLSDFSNIEYLPSKDSEILNQKGQKELASLIYQHLFSR